MTTLANFNKPLGKAVIIPPQTSRAGWIGC